MKYKITLVKYLFLINIYLLKFLAIDDGHDLDRDMLVGIYERIKTNEFKMGSDHVTQVLKVQQTIVGKKPVNMSHISVN